MSFRNLAVAQILDEGLLFNQWTNPLKPSAALRENFPRTAPMGNTLGASAAGTLRLFAVPLCEGDRISSVSFISGTVGLTNGTTPHLWGALYDGSLNLLAQSADDTAGVWAASSLKTFTLQTTQAISRSGLYYAGVMVHSGTGGTQNTYTGLSPSASVVQGLTPVLVGNSTSGLTTTAPNPAAAISVTTNWPYCYVS